MLRTPDHEQRSAVLCMLCDAAAKRPALHMPVLQRLSQRLGERDSVHVRMVAGLACVHFEGQEELAALQRLLEGVLEVCACVAAHWHSKGLLDYMKCRVVAHCASVR